eukprot:jgi/Picre1/32610/NNA_007956.t1
MVFYFKPRHYGPGKDDYLIYMGKDKHENEELIRYSLPIDIWFHVDNLSSAHVYLRLPEGKTIADIPDETLEDCCQLVKANSIQGNKVNKLNIVYTPAKVEKRENEIVNRLNKTKEELYPDLEAEKEAWLAEQRRLAKIEAQRQKALEKSEKEEQKRLKELYSYDRVLTEDAMQTNADLRNKYSTYEEFEDDFM